LETTITIRVRPDGLLTPTKLVNGEEVPLTSRETYYLADELRISAQAIQNKEELAKVKVGTLFYHREQLAHVLAVAGASGIEFRHCDKQGNILSQRNILVFPLDKLVPVKEPELAVEEMVAF
jgi:hypothetical protein